MSRYLPFLDWLLHYRADNLAGDVLAGVIVAIMLVPQAMAYALLAELPPQVGLYASILPLVIYGLLGSSRVLMVGPVAIVSLLVASGVGSLAEPGSGEYIQLCLVLALLVGVIQVGMGLVRLGFLANFLSHPVISGFTSAAAILIAFSQLKHLLGLAVPRSGYFYQQFLYVGQHLDRANPVTVAIGLGGILILLFFKYRLGHYLRRWGLAEAVVFPVVRSAPLVIVVMGMLVVWAADCSVPIVGSVSAGLPPLRLPGLNMARWRMLLPTALVISLVGYMQSISIAESLASKRRQKIDPNQELRGLGMANLGAALSGGYPITGGLSRSIVNFTAGANTGLASIVTALLIALALLFLMPLFYFLPKAILAAIIIVAVVGLFDVAAFRRTWRYNKADAASLIITFVAVLGVGVEGGILIGIGATLALFLWRTSRPHTAVVGRLGDSESFRNIMRHQVQTCSQVMAVRIDESLYFANTRFLEETILHLVADNPQVDRLVLIASAVNFIDASALGTLEMLIDKLNDAGVEFYMAEVKGPVLDRLKRVGFVDRLGEDRLFLSTHQAMEQLKCV